MAVPNYYEVLGVRPNAKLTDINRAYQRWVAEFKKETTAPDPRRESLLQEAYEVLSDEQRRDAHDRELAAQQRGGTKRSKGGAPTAAVACGVLVVAAIGGYFALRPAKPTGPKPRTVEDIQGAMAGSVSALLTYDISGKSAPAGLAFVIEDKVMVANCQQLAPGVQLMVSTGPSRQVPARVTFADPALGLCRLAADGYVGEPLKVNTTPPAVGTRIFAATLGPKGEVGVKEAKVTKVVDGKAVEASVADTAGGNGAPLLDEQGRVIAVATLQPDGKLLHRVVPAAWLAENRVKIEEARPYQGGGGPGATVRTAGAAPDGKRYAPPLANTDYGCACDFENDAEFQGRREARWKEISELPPGEREKAAKLELQGEEFVRKTMKEGNERMRRMAGGS